MLSHGDRGHGIHDLLEMPMRYGRKHVAERDHLSLLCEPDPAIICYCRHGYNGLIGLTTATPYGSTPAVK